MRAIECGPREPRQGSTPARSARHHLRSRALHSESRSSFLLDLQTTAGNAAVGEFLQRLVVQREGGATKATSPTGGVRFATTPADVGAVKVDLRGSLGYNKAEANLGEPAPKKPDSEAASQLKAALAPVKPSGSAEQGKGAKIEATLAGQPVSVSLTDKADLSQPFTIGGQLTAAQTTLTFGTSSLSGSVTLDAFFNMSPKQGGSTTAGLDAGSISGFAFAGTTGETQGPKATVGTVTGTAMAAIGDLPEIVRGGVVKPLQTFDQRRWFLASMRPWFGSDDATLAHFRDIVPSGLPGNVFVHKDAANALAAVKAEVGEDKMPSPENGFAFRGSFTSETKIDRGSMHTIGWAMDFDAVDMPRLGFGKKGAESATLVKLATGQQPNMVATDPNKRRELIRKMGEMSKLAEDDAKRQQFFAQNDVKDFLAKIDTESDRLSDASSKFKDSLGANKSELLSLRPKYFAAQKAKADAAAARTKLMNSLGKTPKPETAEKVEAADKLVKEASDEVERIAARVRELVKPWVDLANAEEARVRERVNAAGVTDLDKIPDNNAVQTELANLRTVVAAVDAMTKRWKEGPPKNAKTAAADEVKLTGWEKSFGPVEGSDVPSKLGALRQALNARVGRSESLSGMKTRYARATALQKALGDIDRIFGTSMTPLADNLSFVQLLEKGFWNPKDTAKGKSGFNALFIKTMAKHGFDVGGNWEGATTDSMHFELVGPKG